MATPACVAREENHVGWENVFMTFVFSQTLPRAKTMVTLPLGDREIQSHAPRDLRRRVTWLGYPGIVSPPTFHLDKRVKAYYDTFRASSHLRAWQRCLKNSRFLQ